MTYVTDMAVPWTWRPAAPRAAVRVVDGARVGLTASAVADLHASHYDGLCRGLAFDYRDHELVEEAVQEAFLTIYRKRDEMRSDQVLGYVRTVAINHIKDVLRRQGRERDITDRGTRLGLLPGEDLGPHVPLDRAVDEWTVQQAVAQLPEMHRKVIVAHYFWGLPDKEIAKILNMREGNVRSTLSRARTALRAAVEAR